MEDRIKVTTFEQAKIHLANDRILFFELDDKTIAFIKNAETEGDTLLIIQPKHGSSHEYIGGLDKVMHIVEEFEVYVYEESNLIERKANILDHICDFIRNIRKPIQKEEK